VREPIAVEFEDDPEAVSALFDEGHDDCPPENCWELDNRRIRNATALHVSNGSQFWSNPLWQTKKGFTPS
jgi:hypothetical protein